MSDRTAASAGVALAGVALAAALFRQSWPDGRWPIAAGLAGIALVAFLLRRHGHLGRRTGAALAGAASVGVVGAAAYAVVGSAAGAGSASVGAGPPVAAAVGVLGGVAAYADWHAVQRDRLVGAATATATGAAVGVAGLFAIVAWSAVVGSLVRVLVPGGIDAATLTALSAVALGLGTGTVAFFYLRGSGRGLSFIDLRRVDRRDLGYVVGGVVAVVALNLAIAAAFRRIGLESAQHTVVRTAQSDPGILLVLVPLSYLIIAPGEELLFRNIVQKSLYDALSRRSAVVVASAIFAGSHILAYASADLLSTLNTLVVIFVLSIVLGATYERTRNVAVPALVHGTFNAVAFAVTYAELSGAGLP